MTRLFGTDGIRGTFGVDLTTAIAADVGTALGEACRRGVLAGGVDRPRVVVGRDTRPSGPALEDALVGGLVSSGADVLAAGVLPTPAVAFLTSHLDADAGVVISASHNPPADNGIKIFGPGGWKLSAQAESRIEDLMRSVETTSPGTVREVSDASERYLTHVVSGADVRGARVVIDCANGAAFEVGPEALRRAGAAVVAINATGDGEQINEGCGALYPDVVRARALTERAIGVTLDGDADRVLVVDEDGALVDGDAILAMLALRLRDAGRLSGDGIVVTVMANQALRRWCDREGIGLVETPVGDRHVLEAMREHGLVLGGEQSGHVIVGDRTTTGDGLLTAIEVLAAVEPGRRLADLVPFEPLPQVLVNVRTNGRRATPGELVRAAIAQAQGRLGEDGRVLVRPSGTEPVVRVMVEAPDARLASDLAEIVAAAVERETS